MIRPAIVLCFALRAAYASDAGPSAPASDWKHAFDLDGDGINDEIRPSFTGGAHCCYKLEVALSSARAPIVLPFEIDGGYVGGLDLSRPDHFDVRRNGDYVELLLEIATVNGRPEPLPVAWIRTFGIRSHHIAVSFPHGRIRARDLA